MRLSKHNPEKGAVLLVVVIIGVITIGLSATYLAMVMGAYKKSKVDSALMQSKYIALAGYKVAFSKVKGSPLPPLFYENLSTDITATELADLSLPSGDMWRKSANWYTQNTPPGYSMNIFGNQGFVVDLYSRQTNGDERQMLIRAIGSNSNPYAENARVEIQALYKYTTICLDPFKEMGAITIQANEAARQALADGDTGYIVDIDGVANLISGHDYDAPEDFSDHNARPPYGVDATGDRLPSSYGISTNSSSPFTVPPNRQDQLIGVGGHNSNIQNIGYQGALLDNICEFVKNNTQSTRINVTSGQHVEAHTSWGTPASNTMVYVSLDPGASIKVNAGKFAGVLVVEATLDTEHPLQTIFETVGNTDWQGLLIFKIKGDVVLDPGNSTIINLNGNPKVVGAMAVYLAANSLKCQGMDEMDSIRVGGNCGVYFSTEAISEAMQLLQTGNNAVFTLLNLRVK
jgi:hypothetical protein